MNKAVDPVLELLSEELTLNAQSIHLTLNQRSDESEDAPGRTTIYRAIDSLEENGYIESVDGHDSYYRLTETGAEYLDSE